MNAKPILFSAPMVRALLDGRKTQTRRIAKEFAGRPELDAILRRFPEQQGCPFGEFGDLIWVRETWAHGGFAEETRECQPLYRADAPLDVGPWTPSIHMPRWASRLTLRITDARVERLQEISEADAKAEGVEFGAITNQLTGEIDRDACEAFEELWESINGPGSWDANPWVWAITFDVIHKNVDALLAEAA